MKDLLRFDTLVAFCALVVSVVTAAVLGYQTHVVEEQYAATIWPYISVDTMRSEHELVVALANNGLGPALIGSAQLFVDGRPASSWTAFVDILKQDPAARHPHVKASTTSLDGSTTIRPGDSLPLLKVDVPDTVPRAVLYKHQMTMRLCYCSLNDRCWNLDAVLGSRNIKHPARTSSCPTTSSIEA